MRVLLLHNRYRQPGGEDMVVRSESSLLRSHGVEVREAWFDNESSGPFKSGGTLRMALNSAWSRPSHRQVGDLCREFRPDVVHVHNFWMRLSPSVHAASHEAGVPTVQTLHNFRLLCGNALLYRNGAPCEDCIGKSPWRAVAHRCYRASATASAAVAAMTIVNRSRGTWVREVNAFIALSEHSRARFITGGLPGERIFVKPNFVPDPGSSIAASSSKHLLYAGRLSPEKGVETLLAGWAKGNLGRYGRLIIAGTGPDGPCLQRRAASLGIATSVDFIGYRPPAEIVSLIRDCRAVAVPSLCYENFPRIVVEAFAHGRPAVVSDSGALREIVGAGTGIRFTAGDAAELAAALGQVLTDDRLADRMGDAAKSEYLRKYTSESNFEQLMRIYGFAREGSLQDPAAAALILRCANR